MRGAEEVRNLDDALMNLEGELDDVAVIGAEVGAGARWVRLQRRRILAEIYAVNLEVMLREFAARG